MQVPLQITIRNMEHSSAVEERVRAKANKLTQFSEQIISCHVVIEESQAFKQNGNLFNVSVHVTMPKKNDLIVNHNEQENLYMAIRDAFDDMTRKVEEASNILQGDVKHHAPIIRGEIVRLFDDGRFGFIASTMGDEYYFNEGNLVKHKFDHLKVGMPVHFIEIMGDEGMRACRVSVSKEHLNGG